MVIRESGCLSGDIIVILPHYSSIKILPWTVVEGGQDEHLSGHVSLYEGNLQHLQNFVLVTMEGQGANLHESSVLSTSITSS